MKLTIWFSGYLLGLVLGPLVLGVAGLANWVAVGIVAVIATVSSAVEWRQR